MSNKSKRRADHFGQNGVEPHKKVESNKPEWDLSDFELEDFLNMDLPEDDDIDWSHFDVPRRPDIDMEDLLYQLGDEQREIPDEHLTVFADLSQADAALVRTRWADVPAARRRWAVRQLLEQYVDELHINLDRFWRIVLHDEDAQVREGAVRGLMGEVFEDLVGSLVQLVVNDPSEDVRTVAASALGAYVLAGELDELDAAPAMRAEEALLDILHNEDEPLDLRCRALESIAFSGEVGVRQLIDEAYYAADEELRVSALVAMGRSADIRWRGKVCAELRNASPAMRAEAAYACGELEAHDGLRDLLELLDDHDETVRLASIFALGRLGGEEARAALQSLAAAPESVESEAAEQALEELQFFAQADSIPLLNELPDDLADMDEETWSDVADMLDDDLFEDFNAELDRDFGSDLDDDDLDDDLDEGSSDGPDRRIR